MNSFYIKRTRSTVGGGELEEQSRVVTFPHTPLFFGFFVNIISVWSLSPTLN